MAERYSWLSGRAQEAVFMNVMSTLLFTPTFCALFLAVLAFLETGRLRSSLKRLHLDWRQLAVASMKWDAVVNAVVFGLVPLQLRVRAAGNNYSVLAIPIHGDERDTGRGVFGIVNVSRVNAESLKVLSRRLAEVVAPDAHHHAHGTT